MTRVIVLTAYSAIEILLSHKIIFFIIICLSGGKIQWCPRGLRKSTASKELRSDFGGVQQMDMATAKVLKASRDIASAGGEWKH